MEKEKYLELIKQDYPEELAPNGFVEQTRKRFLYLDKHPEQWAEEAEWVCQKWHIDPEAAVLEYSYKFLCSFA